MITSKKKHQRERARKLLGAVFFYLFLSYGYGNNVLAAAKRKKMEGKMS
jgi:hypothetical protein